MPAIPLFMAEKPENKLRIYRRRMPHWRLDGSIYFVTWRLYKSQKEIAAAGREVIVSTLKHFEGQRFDLFGYVVMPDHVHVLVKPYQQYLLHELVHSWKSYTVYRLQRDSDR